MNRNNKLISVTVNRGAVEVYVEDDQGSERQSYPFDSRSDNVIVTVNDRRGCQVVL